MNGNQFAHDVLFVIRPTQSVQSQSAGDFRRRRQSYKLRLWLPLPAVTVHFSQIDINEKNGKIELQTFEWKLVPVNIWKNAFEVLSQKNLPFL